MASTDLSRTFASAGNRKKHTYSAWIKLSHLGATSNTFFSNRADNNNRFYYMIANNTVATFPNQFYCYMVQGGSAVLEAYGSAKLRDVSGWYHIVVRMDTTQSTGSDRFRLYINGEQQTLTFGHTPDLNEDLQANKATAHYIGEEGQGNGQFDGSISHIHFCDGYSYAPTEFGETDSTTGIWKPKTSPSVTYGTNGFFLKFENSAAMGTDSSGNSNTFTVNGTMTQTIDTPSNVFATLNPLNGTQPTGGLSLSNGNTTFAGGEVGSNYSYVGCTLAVSSGKWYWETKVTDLAEIDQVGVALASSVLSKVTTNYGLQGTQYGGKAAQFSNGYKAGNGTGGTYMGAFSANDIMMVALDLDNNKITFGRNGQWADGSGNANQTYANSTAAYTDLTAGEFYMPAQAKRAYGSNTGTNQYNFGNGYFGTTAVSSAGTNAGVGTFEYDVPSGFKALCTKNINAEEYS